MTIQKLSTIILSGAGAAGIATATGTFINTSRVIQSNEKIHQETIQSQERIEREKIFYQERIEMEKIELEKAKMGLSSKYSLNSGTSNQKELGFNSTSPDLSSNSSDNCVIPSPFELPLPDMSTHTILQGAGFSFACFAFMGLYAGIALGLNLILKYYGDQKIENLPKWSQTLFKYYSKYLMASNAIYIFFIISSQTISLLLGLYLYFCGI
jgi:hypothetical protein